MATNWDVVKRQRQLDRAEVWAKAARQRLRPPSKAARGRLASEWQRQEAEIAELRRRSLRVNGEDPAVRAYGEMLLRRSGKRNATGYERSYCRAKPRVLGGR